MRAHLPLAARARTHTHTRSVDPLTSLLSSTTPPQQPDEHEKTRCVHVPICLLFMSARSNTRSSPGSFRNSSSDFGKFGQFGTLVWQSPPIPGALRRGRPVPRSHSSAFPLQENFYSIISLSAEIISKINIREKY